MLALAYHILLVFREHPFVGLGGRGLLFFQKILNGIIMSGQKKVQRSEPRIRASVVYNNRIVLLITDLYLLAQNPDSWKSGIKYIVRLNPCDHVTSFSAESMLSTATYNLFQKSVQFFTPSQPLTWTILCPASIGWAKTTGIW